MDKTIFASLAFASCMLFGNSSLSANPNDTSNIELERVFSNALNSLSESPSDHWAVQSSKCAISWRRTATQTCDVGEIFPEKAYFLSFSEVKGLRAITSGEKGLLDIEFNEETTSAFKRGLEMIQEKQFQGAYDVISLQNAHRSAIDLLDEKGIASRETFRTCEISEGLNIKLSLNFYIVSKATELKPLEKEIKLKIAQCAEGEL